MFKELISLSISLVLMASLGVWPGQAQNQKPEPEVIKGPMQKGGSAEASYQRGLKATDAGRYIVGSKHRRFVLEDTWPVNLHLLRL